MKVRQEAEIAELYRLVREHSEKDVAHMLDDKAHWNSNDRFWLQKALEDINKRFDKQDSMIEKIVRNGKPI